jgi:hypothetical protein
VVDWIFAKQSWLSFVPCQDSFVMLTGQSHDKAPEFTALSTVTPARARMTRICTSLTALSIIELFLQRHFYCALDRLWVNGWLRRKTLGENLWP